MNIFTPIQSFNYTVLAEAKSGCEIDYNIDAKVQLPGSGEIINVIIPFHYYNATSIGSVDAPLDITLDTIYDIMKPLVDIEVGNRGVVLSPTNQYTILSYSITVDAKGEDFHILANTTPGSESSIQGYQTAPCTYNGSKLMSGSVCKTDGLKMICPDITGYLIPRNKFGRAFNNINLATYTLDDNSNEVNGKVSIIISNHIVYARTDYIEQEVVLSYLDDRGLIAEAPTGNVVLSSDSPNVVIDNNIVIAKQPGVAVINITVGALTTQVSVTIT